MDIIELKEKIKKNRIGNVFAKLAAITRTLFIISKFNIGRELRSKHIFKNKKYAELKKFKDKHYGERCFIIATGPSLRMEDLEKLNNEITFGMNSLCLSFKTSKWRPTYYGIQDERAYKKVAHILDNDKNITKFISHSIEKALEKDNNIIVYPLNYGKHGSYLDKSYITKSFSDDCFIEVFDGYTITYSLMQLAVYMGFKEIYLLGVDSDYSMDKPHFLSDGKYDYDHGNFAERMLTSYKVAKQYADKNNIKIYNATRGGKLEVFKRKNFDEINLK